MRFLLSVVALLLFCFLSTVYPHAVLQTPAPRSGQGVEPGRKIPQPAGPTESQKLGCGPTGDNIPGVDPGPGPIMATYTAGQTITVAWKITIDHDNAPGVRLALKYSNTDSFNNNILATNVDVHQNQDGDYAKTTITLPAGKSSPNAVLQWIWHSTSDGGYYIACSDIAINSAAAATTTTLPPATTTTKPPTTTTTTNPDGEETTADPEGGNGNPVETTDPANNPGTTAAPLPGASTTLPRSTTRTTRRATTPRYYPVGQMSAATQPSSVVAIIVASLCAAIAVFFH